MCGVREYSRIGPNVGKALRVTLEGAGAGLKTGDRAAYIGG
jgi:hypothetical protein